MMFDDILFDTTEKWKKEERERKIENESFFLKWLIQRLLH
jgi:hypothetical protein